MSEQARIAPTEGRMSIRKSKAFDIGTESDKPESHDAEQSPSKSTRFFCYFFHLWKKDRK